MFVLKVQKVLQIEKERSPGNRASFFFFIENKIGLDKTDRDLYNILACIRLHCLK